MRKNARTGNVVLGRTFNQPVGQPTHRYPTRTLIQPLRVLELVPPPQQPEMDPGIKMEDGSMPSFLINATIDNKEGEIDLKALIHGIEVLEKQINAMTCPKMGGELEFRHLIADPVAQKVWDPAILAEVVCLVDTKAIQFIKKAMIPRGDKAVYTRLVADLRPNKIVHERLRMCMGGDQMNSVMNTSIRQRI